MKSCAAIAVLFDRLPALAVRFVPLLFAAAVVHAETEVVDAQCHTQPRQEMVAHRGARAEWPDNTLPAFEAAIRAGASAVEVDVRMTNDHHLVVMHDPLVDRTTNGHGMVYNLRLEQLRRYQIITAPKLKVPTLAEVLDHVGGRVQLILDLKTDGEIYWQQLAQLLRDHPQRDHVILGVRSLAEAQRLGQLLPGTRQLALIPHRRQMEEFLDAGASIVRLWPKWLKKRPHLGEIIHQQGAALYVPTNKNGPRRVRRLLCYQPHFIQTDDPVKLTATLQTLSQQESVVLTPQ